MFDMEAYSSWAGYGFFVLLILFFIFFLYYSSNESKKPAKINFKKTISEGAVSNSLIGEILPPLNLISYTIISLIILYTIMFALLIS
jgi:hypothetical protein